ncbi:MAG: 2-dehydro-3-deoxyphosphogluconate aldolase/4-hydroxy-2-oxoglutarate aldolase [Herbinix sp.]|jgi:2-dehydro-3-deoxyphosphogluconate aldolase/(4S)-4-hydroxy-2-oxoglutarate aldolase|nr:2-dehydro-3-deoxyphosphogluconate aldolase/4-hydroxy-2-oxoglutarate aldolase [Herbinix sp.]
MNVILETISKLGLVPVIALDKVEDAAPLAKALCDGGLPCAEITFRTEAAEESIRSITKLYPDMLVGAGTVLTIEQVDRAIAAGAKFIVSPGLNPKVVKYCVDNGITIVPGCTNPSDIEQALECGLEVVKFFPAEASGGLSMIKALAAPYNKVKFMPTGGITAKNLTTYLDSNKIIACGGSWMVNNDLIREGNFEGITTLTKEAVSSMLGFDLAHIGINAREETEAGTLASTLENILGYKSKVGNSSIFIGSAIEIMKSPYLGTHGHIAIQTNYIHRAIYHLEMRGLSFDRNTAKFDEKNNLKAVYLVDEYGGFAIHLLQK